MENLRAVHVRSTLSIRTTQHLITTAKSNNFAFTHCSVLCERLHLRALAVDNNKTTVSNTFERWPPVWLQIYGGQSGLREVGKSSFESIHRIYGVYTLQFYTLRLVRNVYQFSSSILHTRLKQCFEKLFQMEKPGSHATDFLYFFETLCKKSEELILTGAL